MLGISFICLELLNFGCPQIQQFCRKLFASILTWRNLKYVRSTTFSLIHKKSSKTAKIKAMLKLGQLTLFDMGGHDAPPKMFLTTVHKRLGGGSWNLVTFNTNLFSIKNKVIFGSLGYSALPWQRVCQGVLEIFGSYHSICFFITKF